MDYSINTKCVQAGYTPGNGEPRQIPIYQSTTYKYDTSEDMGKLFDLEASGYFYSRLQNPTNDYVAAKITALEGGTAAMLLSLNSFSFPANTSAPSSRMRIPCCQILMQNKESSCVNSFKNIAKC